MLQYWNGYKQAVDRRIDRRRRHQNKFCGMWKIVLQCIQYFFVVESGRLSWHYSRGGNWKTPVVRGTRLVIILPFLIHSKQRCDQNVWCWWCERVKCLVGELKGSYIVIYGDVRFVFIGRGSLWALATPVHVWPVASSVILHRNIRERLFCFSLVKSLYESVNQEELVGVFPNILFVVRFL